MAMFIRALTSLLVAIVSFGVCIATAVSDWQPSSDAVTQAAFFGLGIGVLLVSRTARLYYEAQERERQRDDDRR